MFRKTLTEANHQAMGINLLAEDSESKQEVEQGKSKEPDNKIKFKYICSQ